MECGHPSAFGMLQEIHLEHPSRHLFLGFHPHRAEIFGKIQSQGHSCGNFGSHQVPSSCRINHSRHHGFKLFRLRKNGESHFQNGVNAQVIESILFGQGYFPPKFKSYFPPSFLKHQKSWWKIASLECSVIFHQILGIFHYFQNLVENSVLYGV